MRLGSLPERKPLPDGDPDAAGLDVPQQLSGRLFQVLAALDVGLERRARDRDPLALSRRRSSGGTAPEALPKVIIMPNRLRHSIEPSKVALPTPSKTTGTPSPPVISATRFTKSSSLYRITWSHPCSRATSPFSALPTVPITVAPSTLHHWLRIVPMPPAAACTSTVSPALTR